VKLLDRYVSHVIGSLGEYERDVMYRSMIIRRITLFWGTEVAAAALAWTLPANLVWWALIVFFLPMFVSECGAWARLAEVEAATTEYVAWFDTNRLHSKLNYRSPVEVEAEWRCQHEAGGSIPSYITECP